MTTKELKRKRKHEHEDEEKSVDKDHEKSGNKEEKELEPAHCARIACNYPRYENQDADKGLYGDPQTGNTSVLVCSNCFYFSVGVIPKKVYCSSFYVKVTYEIKAATRSQAFSWSSGDDVIVDILPKLNIFLKCFTQKNLIYDDDVNSGIKSIIISTDGESDVNNYTYQTLREMWPWSHDRSLRVSHPADWKSEMGKNYDVSKDFIQNPHIYIILHSFHELIIQLSTPNYPHYSNHHSCELIPQEITEFDDDVIYQYTSRAASILSYGTKHKVWVN